MAMLETLNGQVVTAVADASLFGPGQPGRYVGAWAACVSSCDDDEEHVSSGPLPGIALVSSHQAEAFAVAMAVRAARARYPLAGEVVVLTDSRAAAKGLLHPLRYTDGGQYEPYRRAVRAFAGPSRVVVRRARRHRTAPAHMVAIARMRALRDGDA